jgi:hypothetical protein
MVNGTTTSASYLLPDRVLTRTWQVRGLADLNGDTHSDLLWQDEMTGALAAWLMNGTKMVRVVSIPAISLPVPSPVSPSPRLLENWQVSGLADINRDGHNDVIWRHPQSGDLYVWFMNGTTPTTGAPITPGRFTDTDWQLRGLADFNGDGNVDLLWHHQKTGDVYVWLMNGTTAVSGAYANPARFTNTNWKIVRVSDLNNDGKPDLLWQHPWSGALYAWYMNGTAVAASSYLTPKRPSGNGWIVTPR